MSFESLHFVRPLWLLAIPLFALLIWRLSRTANSSGLWLALCDAALLPHVLESGERRRRYWLWPLLMGGWVAIIALAGPSWERLPQAAANNDYARIFVLDLSRSMAAQDISPSRLERARYKLSDLLDASRDQRTALLVFAGGAWTVSPLTQDINTIKSQLPALSVDLVPQQGGNIAAALRLAQALLQQGQAKHGEVILLTDSTPAADAIRIAAEMASQGIPVSILGVGTADGAPIPMGNNRFLQDGGQLVTARLDENALRELARAGRGDYLRLRSDQHDVVRMIRERTLQTPTAVTEPQFQLGDEWREVGPWLVLWLLPFAALGFRRGWLLTLPLAILLLQPVESAMAAENDSLWQTERQLGWQAFEAENYAQAEQLFSDPLDQGMAQYRAGDFARAAESFTLIDSPKAHYNRGNALAQLGQLQEAIEAYRVALKQQPDHADAKDNLKLVEELLQAQESQDEQTQDGEPEENQPQGDESDEQQDGQQGEEQPPEDGESQSTENSEQSEEQEPSQSGQEGEEEVAEEEAQQTEAAEAEPEDEESETAMTAEELQAAREDQERQMAVQQWLRRVPDDPSGLLRRKFEHQQRLQQQNSPRQPTQQEW